MSSIDNKVVEMTFNNASFERRIADTIRSLDNLKGKLDFAGSSKSLQDLGSATSKFNMGSMGSAIDGISNKFLAMSAVGLTVISNLTNRVVDAGIRMGKSLSLDQVISGFREYETNLNSIQTVLANTESKGTNLQDVNAALDELNTYADQTIYNFSEMTRNIGTFTAAGVDLDTSTQAIKGIANLAAISGSNSQQASTAMYQLSQALASGSVKLMDWNSIVNAGMGGEVFQKSLFETGKALGTIKDVPLDQTFDEWKDAGNTFRGSLEEGWITAEVLTNTLQGFTGDLTKAQVLALGYTEEQADAIIKMGQTGKDAATKVKTLTQLISTVKEAVGSGWSTSFRTIIGDFEQAKELFTDVSNVIGKIVGDSADSRNRLLTGWANLGGRKALIDGLANAFQALGAFLKPIQEAFRDIFPPMTAHRLATLTKNFEKFTESLKPNELAIIRVRRIFRGLFAAMEIGWTIVKETIGFFKDLFDVFTEDLPKGGIVTFLAQLGDDLVGLNKKLVSGGGIADFFDSLTTTIKKFVDDPMAALEDIKNKLIEVFDILVKGDFSSITSFGEDSSVVKFLTDIRTKLEDLIGVPDSLAPGFDRLEQRVGGLRDAFKKLTTMPDWLSDGLERVKDILDTVGEAIGTWFSQLGDKMAEAMGPGDFDAVLDAMNVSLLGGIGLLIAKFLKGGIKFDIGGGVFEKLGDTLGALTGHLEAMTLNVKANALLKIAGAVALLTASVAVLAMIDSAALTKALTAMTVGFGQLIGTMLALGQLNFGPKTAGTMVVLSTGLVLIAGAMALLSIAVKNMAGLNWNELARGLTGVVVLLTTLAAAAKALQGNTAGLIRAGIGITAIAIALNILALAMKIFATMSWEEMSKGLVGVAGGLAGIVAAVNLLPDNMATKGAGILLIGVGLNFIASAMKIFATMSWEEMGKGLTGVAGGLVGIAIGMRLMPKSMLATSAGLVLVGTALNLIAVAMKSFAGMDWKEIGRGLAAMGGSLLILAGAMFLMNGSLAGAAALAIVASSLWLLVEVIKGFSGLSVGELVTALAGFAGVLITLGLTALVLQPLIPALLGLGIAMFAVGAGFALFGIGAQAIAKAFVLIASAGKAGVEVLLYAFDQLITRLPTMVGAFALSILELVDIFLKAAPVIIKGLGVLLGHILDTVIKLIPKLKDTFVAFVTAGLEAIIELAPKFAETAVTLLITFLTAIRDNIQDVATLGIDIILELLTAITGKMPDIVEKGVELLVEFLKGVAKNLADVVTAGVDILVELIKGITKNIENIGDAATDLVVAFIKQVGKLYLSIIAAGKDMIIDFIKGIGKAAGDVVTAGVDTVLEFLQGVSDNAQRLVDKGFQIVIQFINGMADAIDKNSDDLHDAGWNLAVAIADGMTAGLASKAGSVVGSAADLGKKALGAIAKPWEWGSPSKTMIRMGEAIAEGLTIGLDRDTSVVKSAKAFSNRATNALQESLSKIPDLIGNINDFNPTITPILDLTSVKNEASKLGSIFDVSKLAASVSFDQASIISVDSIRTNEDTTVEPQEIAPREVKFEQNNYSPKALSTADIYRQTKSQIVLAKEELSIA